MLKSINFTVNLPQLESYFVHIGCLSSVLFCRAWDYIAWGKNYRQEVSGSVLERTNQQTRVSSNIMDCIKKL